MKIIRYIDLVGSSQDDEGNFYDEVHYSNYALPTTINEKLITTINPLFTLTGRLYKHVSVIKVDNELMKVMGSVEYLEGLMKDKGPTIGFTYGQQKQKTIEDRAEVKSKPKRRTKGSSKKVL